MLKHCKERKKVTLMRWSKEELVDLILLLEHNINVINESFDNQYSNCLRILDDMKLINKTYFEVKQIINASVLKGGVDDA